MILQDVKEQQVKSKTTVTNITVIYKVVKKQRNVKMYKMETS